MESVEDLIDQKILRLISRFCPNRSEHEPIKLVLDLLKSELKSKNGTANDQNLQDTTEPIMYVISIFGLFSLIFAFILCISYRYNRIDNEIIESKIFIKKWKNFYNQESSSIHQNRKSWFGSFLTLNFSFKDKCFNISRENSQSKSIKMNKQVSNFNEKRNHSMPILKLNVNMDDKFQTLVKKSISSDKISLKAIKLDIE
jgi:hypothetical protein